MTIHREGYKLLFVTAFFLITLNFLIRQFLGWSDGAELTLLLVSIILFFLVLQFFRNPKVIVSENESLVYAPADGKVVVVEETSETEYFDAPRRQISIFMSPINVHINRNPVSGVIKFFKYHAGKYLVAWHPKSSKENEHTTLVVETGSGTEVMIRQIAGAMARRIKCYVSKGDMVKQGEVFGFIKFGSRVDVLLPPEAQVEVNVGDKTRAGRTVLAKF